MYGSIILSLLIHILAYFSFVSPPPRASSSSSIFVLFLSSPRFYSLVLIHFPCSISLFSSFLPLFVYRTPLAVLPYLIYFYTSSFFLEPSCLPLLCYSFLIFFTSTRPPLILLDHPVCLSFVTLLLLPLVCILLFFLISPPFVYNLTLSFSFPYFPRFSPSVHFSRISNISCSFLLSSPPFSSYPSTILPLTSSFYILLFYSSFSLLGPSSITFSFVFLLLFVVSHLLTLFSSAFPCLFFLLTSFPLLVYPFYYLSRTLYLYSSLLFIALILEPSYHCLFIILPSLRDFSFQSIFVPLLFSFHFSPLLCIPLAPLGT